MKFQCNLVLLLLGNKAVVLLCATVVEVVVVVGQLVTMCCSLESMADTGVEQWVMKYYSLDSMEDSEAVVGQLVRMYYNLGIVAGTEVSAVEQLVKCNVVLTEDTTVEVVLDTLAPVPLHSVEANRHFDFYYYPMQGFHSLNC